jgi:hypothetical protein
VPALGTGLVILAARALRWHLGRARVHGASVASDAPALERLRA